MTKFYKIKMDTRAITYIEDVIDNGLSLSSKIGDAIELSKGSVFTFFPNGISPTNLYNFQAGGKMPESPEETWTKIKGGISKPVLNTEAFLVDMIRKYMQKERDNICIFENFLARKSDPWLKKKKVHVLFYKDEVYHVVSNENSDTKHIFQTIRHAQTVFHFLGVMSSLPIEDQKTIEHGERTDVKWDIIIRNLKKIIVGAYDGESYLVWERM